MLYGATMSAHFEAQAVPRLTTTIYRIDPEWTALRSFEEWEAEGLARENRPVIDAAGNIVVFHDGGRHAFDLASQTWSETRVGSVLDVEQQPDGTLVEKELPPVLMQAVIDFMIRTHHSVRHRVSTDYGETWRRAETQQTIERRRGGGGYSTRDGLFASIAVKRKGGPVNSAAPMFLRLAPSLGSPMQWRGQMPGYCSDLLANISTDDALYVACEDGRLLRSADLGLTWEVDRPSGI